MQDVSRADRLRSIGVSNFHPGIPANFCERMEIVLVINQVELHLCYTQGTA